jgi:hypothetical protein
MQDYNLVAVYPTLAEARRVSDRLLAEGISAADVRLTDASAALATADASREPHRERGFFDWLFASDVPDYDRERYTDHLNENRSAVSVRAADQHWHDRIIEIMEEFNPIDIEEDGDALAHERSATGTSAMGAATVPTAGAAARTDIGAAARSDSDSDSVGRTDMSREREAVIPIVKEEIDVGKRVSERRYRVKSYIIEHPVEKQATVRDERVEIEHRPISRTSDLRMPQEREIEVVERHEEPFAEKRMTGNEEIVVRKEVVERPETVRGTVRETRVEVEKEPAVTDAAGATPAKDRAADTTPRAAAPRNPGPGTRDRTNK